MKHFIRRTATIILSIVIVICVLSSCKNKEESVAQTSADTVSEAGYESSEDAMETEEAYDDSDEAEETEEAYEIPSDEEIWRYIIGNMNEQSTFTTPNSKNVDFDPEDFPAQFDLRDNGVVTPVKDQTPWGVCWGFGTIAACETSILSEMGKTYEETGLDLSERHLAWFARTYLKDGSSQDGEGVHLDEGINPLDGNMIYTATSLLSSGVGVVKEDSFPYRGNEGIMEDGKYSRDDDWSIDDEYRFVQSYELEETMILPTTVMLDEDDNYEGFDEGAMYAIKEQLMEGRAVAMSYLPKYENMNWDTWSQYNPEVSGSTHTVCIVGWDDEYPSEMFVDHSDDEDGDGTPMQPEGNGAWIVKNSWGAETSDDVNKDEWGIRDANGLSTGYFYLSFYDRTFDSPEAFDFKVEDNDNDYYLIDQYDYLQTSYANSWYYPEAIAAVNVFEAEEDEVVRCISAETAVADTDITYALCLLEDGATSPEESEEVCSGSFHARYPGYHRIDLEEPLTLSAGQKYAILIYQSTEIDGNEMYAFSCDAAHNKQSHDASVREYGENATHEWAVGIVNPGESWLYIADIGKWYDWKDIVDFMKELEVNIMYDYDNFPIKGYADPIAK